jgi:hypothetical protein
VNASERVCPGIVAFWLLLLLFFGISGLAFSFLRKLLILVFNLRLSMLGFPAAAGTIKLYRQYMGPDAEMQLTYVNSTLIRRGGYFPSSNEE